ncbi:non-ribosomal peptide synthetase [Flavobacterium branchiicola]|uniref:Non-ribosomal peptide synthetase n=1 Tax=Flavobacterium branchiicola TaxID=1114875 RepID=A0ABV9PJR5_9FLAO|nr:non-ribosomal peptide synthetase [Flavobacterium branchiicola]MBS7256338.1 amino acid adenylation domain-containing protein [Flavobacterium branchiicola]
MEIITLLKELRTNGIALKIVDDQLKVSLLNENIGNEIIEKIKSNKYQIIDYLKSLETNKFKEIPKVEEAISYPVANAQFRIWFESQSANASKAYHIPFELKLEGDYDHPILEQALCYVIDRHEILRTVFRLNHENELSQYILPVQQINFKVDYSDFSAVANFSAEIDRHIESITNTEFDLENGPLIRVALLKYQSNKYYFYCNMHHIICDAWSIPILKNEILLAYNALKSATIPLLPELKIQYKDFAAWSLQNLKEESFIKQKTYWLEKFSGKIPVLDFPVKGIRPPVKTYEGETLKTYFNKDVSHLIQSYKKDKGASLHMIMTATLHVLLARYSGNDDIIIGSPFAAREHIDLNNQIGFFTNTLAIRNRLDKQDSFDTFFNQVKQSLLEGHTHQQYPFEELVKELKLKKDPSRNPLFDVMLVVMPKNGSKNTDEDPDTEALETIVKEKNTTSKFDLLVYIEEDENDLLSLKIEYSTDLFEEKFIRQFITHYKKIVALLLTKPEEKISSLNYLEGQIGIQNHQIDLEKYTKETVISFFENQAGKTPDAVALVYDNVIITYRQVNNYSNQIAQYLRENHGITPNTNVGVLLNRSQYNVIAMLGVIKSGGCYVPVDNKYLKERKNYIIKDAAIKIILTTGDIKVGVDAIDIIYLDEFEFTDEPTENPVVVNDLDDHSFIIYTSGSTGNPKGVIQTHRMLSNLIQWNKYDSGIPSGLKHLQYTSFSFDVSLQDVWFVLGSGGTLYITPEAMKLDFDSLSKYITKNKVEVLCFPFSALSSFFDFTDQLFFENHNVKHVISSGEQLVVGRSLENFLLEFPHVNLHNHYGPSETHVVTSHTISAQAGTIANYVPIGRPLPNTTIYLLDNNLQPVPEKVIGEIYVGGDNLANGYVNLPELTQTRFITNPFNASQKLYKTGDLAYVDYSGILIYLGRNDTQVKIRGYRIELEEIELQILKFSNVIEHAVVEAKKINDENVLAVYYVSKEDLNKSQIVSFLKSRLPDYMIPNFYIKLENIPLTSNGKVDRKALPDIILENNVSTAYVAPTNETEAKLAAIWQEILNIEKVGIMDNFFELGGHSLYVVRMIYKINEVFAIKMKMKDVFTMQNIYELAQSVDNEVVFTTGINAIIKEEITNDKNSEIWEI